MSKLKIKVKPSSNKNKIVKMGNGVFKVWLKSAPERGKANKELQKYLKQITGIPIKISSGLTSENKTIEFDIEKMKFVKKLEKQLKK
jgi:uncharacterized protein